MRAFAALTIVALAAYSPTSSASPAVTDGGSGDASRCCPVDEVGPTPRCVPVANAGGLRGADGLCRNALCDDGPVVNEIDDAGCMVVRCPLLPPCNLPPDAGASDADADDAATSEGG